jgi:hypothetical protein
MRFRALHVGAITDGSAQRYLAVPDLDLDAARIEADIVGKAFAKFAANVGVRVAIAPRLAHFGRMVLTLDAVDLAHAMLPGSLDPTKQVRNGLPWPF